MEVAPILHMNGGSGDLSYASNSLLQLKVISMTKPIAEEAINSLYSSNFPTKFTIADLGCSSGPNTLMAVSELIKAVEKIREKHNKKPIEYQVLLNDLPGNDFNTIFKSLPNFIENLKMEIGDHCVGPCLFNGVPGSFYGRLFPSKSVNFIHSSYSLHWLSKVPEGLEENKRNIYMVNTSPKSVVNAYYKQFQKDFELFLKLRREELVKGGSMVLTLMGRRSQDPNKQRCYIWEILGMALDDMVSEGIIEEEKLESFNIPKYMPSPTEMRIEIEKEGSFVVNRIQVSEVDWKLMYNNNQVIMNQSNNNNNKNSNNNNVGYTVGKYVRAVAEPMLISHFGEAIMEELFIRYGQIIVDRMGKENLEFVNLTISLTNIT